jgi:hypothetical protein
MLPLPCIYISEIIYHIKLHLEKLEQNSTICNHDTQQKLNCRVQFCRTGAFKKGVMSTGFKLYIKCRKVEKIWHFKREMRSYPLQHIF